MVKAQDHYSGEFSWPPLAAIAVILGLSLVLPGRYRFFPQWVVASVFVAAFVLNVLAFVAGRRARPDAARAATLSQVALISIVVLAQLINLLLVLVEGGKDVRGLGLLSSGVQVWVSNVLAFGLWYWLLDRGGPHARRIGHAQRAEFLFPEMTAGDVADPHWSPNIIEYMYLSFTNSTAFSPTDTLPLSSRVRALMTAESAMSLVTIALVAARAVNILT